MSKIFSQNLTDMLRVFFHFSFLFFYSLNALALPLCPIEIKTSLTKVSFMVEVAKTRTEREQGLMNREFLAQQQGMLFVFAQPGKYGFWMKKTNLSLDILFFDQHGHIVDIIEATKPDSTQILKSTHDFLWALELTAGQVRNSNIKKGDHADLLSQLKNCSL